MAEQSRRARVWVARIRGINPHAVDVVLALAFSMAALWTVTGRVSGSDNEFRHDDALGIGLLLLQTLPIAVRSVAPLAALTVSVVAISIHVAVGYEGVPAGTFSALIIVYSAASLTDTRQGILAALITAAGVTVYYATNRGDPGMAEAVTTYATYGAGWGLGTYARARREYTGVVEERAYLLERERELQAREAVARERTRIARELHDAVGHALNVIVIQSGGAQRVFDTRPQVARDSLASIESTGRQALSDMERMLDMLRATDTPDDALSPQPGLGDVHELAKRVSEAGLPVQVHVEGEPATIPPSVGLSAYRIIQEALTNALKHAGPARASVYIRYEPESLNLEIVDDGKGPLIDGSSDIVGGGRGLIGMKERVALFGGEVHAAPRAEGGFRVHARLPVPGERS